MADRYDVKEAYKQSQAKQSVERGTKIQMVYRKMQELDTLKSELDSAFVKKKVDETDAQFNTRVLKPIKDKIAKAKKELNTEHSKVLKSNDKQLVQEYKETLADDNELSSATNYKPSTVKTTKPMAKDKKEPKGVEQRLKYIRENYQDLEAELNFLEAEDPNSKEYKTKKAEFDNALMYYVFNTQKQKEEKFEKDLADAKAKKDWGNASKILAQKKAFDNSKIDFSKTQKKLEVDEGFRYSTKEFDQPFERTGDTEFDIDMEDLRDQFDYEMETAQQDPSTITLTDEEVQAGQNATAGTTNTQTTSKEDAAKSQAQETTSTNTNIDDAGVLGDEEKDYKFELNKAKKELDDFYAFEREQDEFEFDYAPDSQSDTNVFENLIDAGRGVVGMIGAMKDVPEYQRGEMFQQAMDEATRMRDMGLSADELAYRERQQEEAYGYDIKNIRRLAGGSAGVALGNLGRAQQQLYGAKSQTAAIDEATRRQNRMNFQQMSLRDEAVNRQIFQDKLRQVEMDKQAGAGLVADALANIKERADFNRQYGKGSIYYQYAKDRSKDIQQQQFYREQGQKNRMFQMEQELKGNVEKAQSDYDKKFSITGDNTQEVINNTKQQEAKNKATTTATTPTQKRSIFKSNVKKDEKGNLYTEITDRKEIPIKPATKEKPDTRSLTSKNIDTKLDELTKQMDETDDIDLAMELDSKINQLKEMRRKGKGIPPNF